MNNQALATVPTAAAGAVAPMSFSDEQKQVMKQTVAKGCTNPEFALLLQLASAYGLDPFRKEIWAIKRKETEAALIMTSRDGYLKIAQRDPNYLGLQAAVVKKGDHFRFNPGDGTVEHSFGAERGAIIGAWAIAHHRARMPIVCFVEFSEYRGNSPTWANYPSAMIQKVAEVFVLKRQFNINGLVTTEEMDAGEAPTTHQPNPSPSDSYAPSTPRRPATTATVERDDQPAVITESQRRRLFAIAKEHNVDEHGLRQLMKDNGLGIGPNGEPSTHVLTQGEHYEALCDRLIPGFHKNHAAGGSDDVEDAEFEEADAWPGETNDPQL